MRQTEVNGQVVMVAPAIEDFIVKQKPSSNVEYFGFGPTGDIFIQFKNGSSYIYKNCDPQLVQDMLAAESIGKFVGRLKGLECLKHGRLVDPVMEVKNE